MRFTCLTENLSKGLGIVNKAIPMRSSLPILSNVLITAKDGRLFLSGTNLDTAITTYVGASIDEEGATTVPAKMLSEFVSHLSSETVLASLAEDILYVEAGKTKSRFNGVSSSDFPDLPEIKKNLKKIELDTKTFCNSVSQVGFSVATDATRPVFTGVFMNYSDGKLTIVGSDGFRLSEKIIQAPKDLEEFTVIVPAKTLLEVARIMSSCDENLKIYVNEDENLCLFEGCNTVVATRIIDGSYPDYKRIIPKDTNVTAEFSSTDLLEAVKLTNVFAKNVNNAIRLTLSPQGLIKVRSTAHESGENNTDVKAQITGEELELVFNVRYLLEFLTNNKYETLIFEAIDSSSPCILTSKDEKDFLHVMAPMQLSD